MNFCTNNFCTKCGKELFPGNGFCGNCGHPRGGNVLPQSQHWQPVLPPKHISWRRRVFTVSAYLYVIFLVWSCAGEQSDKKTYTTEPAVRQQEVQVPVSVPAGTKATTDSPKRQSILHKMIHGDSSNEEQRLYYDIENFSSSQEITNVEEFKDKLDDFLRSNFADGRTFIDKSSNTPGKYLVSFNIETDKMSLVDAKKTARTIVYSTYYLAKKFEQPIIYAGSMIDVNGKRFLTVGVGSNVANKARDGAWSNKPLTSSEFVTLAKNNIEMAVSNDGKTTMADRCVYRDNY